MTTLTLFANTAFISAEELYSKLSDKNLVILDTTTLERYSQAHIPNARQVEISAFRTLVDNRHELMRSSKEIEKVAQDLGINHDSYVVLYGHNQPKELLKASYIAMALIVNGFTNLSILDGGFSQWSKKFASQKGLISKEVLHFSKGNFKAHYNPEILVDMTYVKNHIGKVEMIEARERKYFDGALQSSGVKRLGHIPNAQSSNWQDKFTTEEKKVSNMELKRIFFDKHKLDSNKELITYCTGGLEASMNWYLLTQDLNFTNVKMYDASMKEWGNIDSTPMQTKQK